MELPQTIPNKRWTRIVATAFLMYSISFMDRINLGFGFAGMQHDLGFSATISGLAGSVFFLGYFLLQIPGGRVAERAGAKRIITIAMIFWSVFAIATGLVRNSTELLIVRFLLGLSEGCVYPAMMVLLASWFPREERGRAISYFILCIPFGAAIMSPLSGLILTFASWRALFVIEGAVPLVMAVFWWFLIADSPAEAKWLSDTERDYLHRRLRETGQSGQASRPTTLGEALRNRNVRIMVATYFFLQIGQYGFGLWLPTIVKAVAGGSPLRIGIISALPWAAGMLGLVINGRHSDRTGERKVHTSVAVIVGALFLLISTMLGPGQAILSICSLILAIGFFQSYNGVVWVIPSEIVAPEILGTVAGLINGLGTLGGGFVGPLLFGYLRTKTGSVLAGELSLVGALVAAGLLVLTVRLGGKARAQTVKA
jgi:sugar phosphate permease